MLSNCLVNNETCLTMPTEQPCPICGSHFREPHKDYCSTEQPDEQVRELAAICSSIGLERNSSSGDAARFILTREQKLRETIEAMQIQFTQLANAAACLYSDSSFAPGSAQSSRSLVKAELERSKHFLKR
jgi:hypothetical protein